MGTHVSTCVHTSRARTRHIHTHTSRACTHHVHAHVCLSLCVTSLPHFWSHFLYQLGDVVLWQPQRQSSPSPWPQNKEKSDHHSSENAPERGSKQAMSMCPWQTIPEFPNGSAVTNLPAMQETWVRSLGQKDPLEEEMATYSSILAWEILCTEEPGRLLSMGSQSQTQLNVWVQHRIDHSCEHGDRIYSDDSLPNSWLWAHAVSS